MLLCQVCKEKYIIMCVYHQFEFVFLNKSSLDPAVNNSWSGIYCVLSVGMLKIHSGGSSSQQTVLTIPANQLKQLGVGTGSGGLQTILMPVGKGRHPCDSSLKHSNQACREFI